MALKIKCNYNKTSNLRFPYVVRTLHLKFNFSNKRDAQRFCKQKTKELKKSIYQFFRCTDACDAPKSASPFCSILQAFKLF